MGELTERFLAELGEQLPFQDDERDDIVEEVASHIEAAEADLTAAGIASEDAERRVIKRFGQPERLADDLAAARRDGLRWRPVIGAALRVTVGTSFWTIVVSWVAIVIVVATAGSAATLTASILHHQPSLTWPASFNALLGAIIYGLAAFAVGRALPPAIAIASRRRVARIRPWILVLGLVASTWLGWFQIEARFDGWSAWAQALLPAWFALGVLRPRSLPGWLPPSNVKGVGVVLLLLAMVVMLPLGLLASTRSNVSSPAPIAVPPPEQAEVAPLVPGWASLFSSSDSSWFGETEAHMAWQLADPHALDGWTDLHLEVWLGLGPDNGSGLAVLDPSVDHPLVRFPIVRTSDGTLAATFASPQVPGHIHYVVALLATDPAGTEWQLTDASDEMTFWSGSVWQFVTAQRP